jgi:arabinogalactan oligomer/maltooligosaccharide transport system permease protein
MNSQKAKPTLYILPALVLMTVLSLLPNLYSVYLAFTNFRLYHYHDFSFVGLRNFGKIFSANELRTFLRVGLWTVAWAGFSVLGAMVVGLFLAIPLNREDIKGSKLYRTLFIVPWAIPAFISVLMWQGLLNESNGAINQLLGKLGIGPIPWLNDPLWACISVLMVNIWLGYPFMMTICLSSLQVYEAADIDGASAWTQFRQITLPLLKASLIPVTISNFAFNFNQFTAIYLLTNGGPSVPGSEAGATDILITYSYKLAFNLYQYGIACAYAIIIFIVVAGVSGINMKLTGTFDHD